jgi:hypothetical protein
MSKQSMMLVEATWQDKTTFRMIPISDHSPYVECIFDPESQVFVVVSKIKKTSLHMLPKLCEYGNPIKGTRGSKQERHKIEVFQEFYVEDKAGMDALINLLAVNPEFDYKKFMTDSVTE